MQTQPGKGNPPTVLIVNGDIDTANRFAIWLGKDSTVHVAHDRKTASTLLDETVDVVVVERNLPDKTNLDILATLHHKNLDCQVAMLTDEESLGGVIETEVDDYLVKPVSEAELCETVEQLVAYATYTEKIDDLYELTVVKSLLETHSSTDLMLNGQFDRFKMNLEELDEELIAMTDSFSEMQFAAEIAQLSTEDDSGEGSNNA